MPRPTVKRLSEKNLLHNLSVLKKQAPASGIIAMVKANAYGHGALCIAQRLEGKVAFFGVATLTEALVLREGGISGPIIVMGGVFSQEELSLACLQKIAVVVHTHQQKEWVLAQRLPVCVWVKVNTGLNRLGFLEEEAEEVYQQLAAHPGVVSVRVLSHFACADDKDHPLNAYQKERMKKVATAIPAEMSFCNTAATFVFPECHEAYVRPGIGLYGCSPLEGETLGLRPVMTLESQLMAVRMLPKGASVGYSARFVAEENMPVGVVAIGYADGYMRAVPKGTCVMIQGALCPILGTVAMDMMMVDMRLAPTAKVGDTVVLWGEGLPLEKVATQMGRITYDVMASLLPRVETVWEE